MDYSEIRSILQTLGERMAREALSRAREFDMDAEEVLIHLKELKDRLE